MNDRYERLLFHYDNLVKDYGIEKRKIVDDVTDRFPVEGRETPGSFNK